VVFALVCALPAHAETLMSLPKLSGYKAFTTTNGSDYQGQCGSARIIVENVNDLEKTYFTNISVPGLVTTEMTFKIFNPAKPSQVLMPVADQINGVACVQTPQGKLIVIWVNCGEKVCTSDFDHFYIIDPENLAYLAPKDPDPFNSECDRACAKLLVGNLPATSFLFVEPPKDDRLMSWPSSNEARNFKTSDTHTFKGQCGPAKIIIKNVNDDNSEHPDPNESYGFSQYELEFIVYNPAKPGMVLKPHAGDFNSIACVQTAQGKRILHWENCGGSVCSEATEWTDVIDPEKMVYILPKDRHKK
jgi:hypothetical protein